VVGLASDLAPEDRLGCSVINPALNDSNPCLPVPAREVAGVAQSVEPRGVRSTRSTRESTNGRGLARRESFFEWRAISQKHLVLGCIDDLPHFAMWSSVGFTLITDQ
jgi:hypothetical protein